VSEDKLAARLEKVTERLEAGAPNMSRPGADLIPPARCRRRRYGGPPAPAPAARCRVDEAGNRLRTQKASAAKTWIGGHGQVWWQQWLALGWLLRA
jgi:hypothetical protein